MIHRPVTRFWSGPIYSGPLVLARVALGVILISTSIFWMIDRHIWFAQDSLWPISYITREGISWLQPLLPTNAASVVAWLLVMIISGVGITLGFYTRRSALFGFLALVILQEKQPAFLHGGDLLLRALLFGLIFSPAGNMFSLDAKRKGISDEAFEPWGFRFMQIQVAIVYISTALWKVKGEAWWNGEAIWRSWHIEDFARWNLPPVWPGESVAIVLSVSVVIIEFLLAGLLFMEGRTKKLTWSLGLVLHLGIAVMMVIEIFPWVSIAGLLLFIPKDWCRKILYLSKAAWQNIQPPTLKPSVPSP